MEVINLYKGGNEPLEVISDNRGRIADVFYNKKIDHVAIIQSLQGSLRGNHYHKETKQHILILSGTLEYWYKDANSTETAHMYRACEGDLITSPPYEIHALKIGTDSEFMEFVVFSEGKRGGRDYELDTFRVEDITR